MHIRIIHMLVFHCIKIRSIIYTKHLVDCKIFDTVAKHLQENTLTVASVTPTSCEMMQSAISHFSSVWSTFFSVDY